MLFIDPGWGPERSIYTHQCLPAVLRNLSLFSLNDSIAPTRQVKVTLFAVPSTACLQDLLHPKGLFHLPDLSFLCN